ncbi:MAG TPA: TonB family protein [Methylocella sp.]|nr:TonB family protein [Methylocella sp.]
MRTDSEPEGSSKKRNLAADRGDRFSGPPKQLAAAPDRRCRLAKITAASVLAHGCLLLAFVLLDEGPSVPAREIPVEVVTEPAPPEKRPAAQAEATRAPSREPRQRPKTETNPKPANEAMSGPNPGTNRAEPQPSATHAPEARAKLARNDTAERRTARLAGGPRQNGGSEYRRPLQTGFALPFDSGPDSFRAVALPVVSESGGEAVRYSFLVGGMLERVKRYPETARQRRAKGIAIIGFHLDEAGQIASVSLLRSSGEADLDAESVALVNRAAPFPPPPPGAQDSFAIEVAFGMGS